MTFAYKGGFQHGKPHDKNHAGRRGDHAQSGPALRYGYAFSASRAEAARRRFYDGLQFSWRSASMEGCRVRHGTWPADTTDPAAAGANCLRLSRSPWYAARGHRVPVVSLAQWCGGGWSGA